MPNGIQVRPSIEASDGQLASFFARMFPDRAGFLKSHWRWLYRVGSTRTAVTPLVALDAAGTVIGHAGVIPVTLRRGAQEVVGSWFVDFAVLPEHQRHGIGRLLTERWMDMTSVRVAFCNDRSAALFLKYGWRLRFDTQSLQLPLRPEAHPEWSTGVRGAVGKTLGFALRNLSRMRTMRHVPPVVRGISDESLATFAVTGTNVLQSARTDEFLTWRVTASPNVSEHFVLDGTSASQCAALARICRDGRSRRLHLLAVRHAGQSRALSDFFGGVVRWALDQRVDHVWLVTGDPVVMRAGRRWLPLVRPARFAYHAQSQEAFDMLSGAQHWEALDSDFDLMFA